MEGEKIEVGESINGDPLLQLMQIGTLVQLQLNELIITLVVLEHFHILFLSRPLIVSSHKITNPPLDRFLIRLFLVGLNTEVFI